jgi:sulfite reductase alpha subunit-like flavoprotein
MGEKTYVQDLLHRNAEELRDLIVQRNAHVYVCGDASRMAKDVFKAFSQLVQVDGQGSSSESGTSYLVNMKAAGRWSEDVW